MSVFKDRALSTVHIVYIFHVTIFIDASSIIDSQIRAHVLFKTFFSIILGPYYSCVVVIMESHSRCH